MIKPRKKWTPLKLLAGGLVLFFALTGSAAAYYQETYPKLANYYLPWDIEDNEAKDLAKWDIIIVHTQAIDRNPGLLEIIKQHNPKIKILAYVPSQEIHAQGRQIDPTGAWGKIYQQVDSADWWLKDTAQKYLNHWPNTRLINITDQTPPDEGLNWNHWLPEFINENYLKKNLLWDGIFYDNCWPTIDWLNFSLDLNNDGRADSQTVQNSLWAAGMTELLRYTKQIIAPEKIIVCNGGTDYRQNYQGRMFESFPVISEGGWAKNLSDYLITGQYSIINANTANLGNQTDYQKMRFGLTSALLGDGYYSFDSGDLTHGQKWWYDEYDAYLGKALGPARIFKNGNAPSFYPEVWQRHFENGLVLVNATNQTVAIDLDNKYEKIKGEQDTLINSGQLVNSLKIRANDGIVLLKPLDKLIGASFNNGSFARIFNEQGQTIRNGFFAYNKNYGGGLTVIWQDINHDAKLEAIVGNNNLIKIYDAVGRLISQFAPYGDKFAYGFRLALADLDNNGTLEIITVPKNGAPAHVKTFSLNGRWLNPGFFAYPALANYGASLAIADINQDGVKEIITAPGRNNRYAVRTFTKDGKPLTLAFSAFDKEYQGGVNVAAGDINGDGTTEIIVSRQAGTSEIKLFKINGTLIKSWLPFKNSSGIEVGALDIDGNGRYEIITLTNEIL